MNAKHIYEKPLFCVCGETSSGKDTFIRMAIEKFTDELKAVCSYSTRPMRDNEVEGREHYFSTKSEFHKLMHDRADDILGYTKITSSNNPDGYEYMALIDELEDSNLYIIDPLGLKYLKDHFGDKISNIVVIYITAPLNERVSRAKERSDFNTEFKKRVMNEYEQFLDFNIDHAYDYVIKNYNGRFYEAFDEFIDIIQKYL